MPHVHQSEVKARAHKAPLHSRPVRPRTPPSTPPENDPHHHAADAAQYHPAAEAPQYEAAHDDPHTDAADKHQTDTGEAKAPQNDTSDPAPAHTPHNPADTVSGPPSGMDPSVTLIPQQHHLSLDQP